MKKTRKSRQGIKSMVALLIALIMTIGALPHEVFATSETSNVDIPTVAEIGPITISIADEYVELPPDGIVTVEVNGQLVEMEIPRFLYVDGEHISIDDERIESITPVVPMGNAQMRGFSSAPFPRISYIIPFNMPSNVVINPPASEFEFDGDRLWLDTANEGRMAVGARRYYVNINGLLYEAYCANPNLRGPGSTGAAYVMTGIQAEQFRPVLRYGFPHNPHGNSLDANGRRWFLYMTRVAVGLVGNPGATVTTPAGGAISSGVASTLQQISTGTFGSAPASLADNPPITVGGPNQSSDHQTGASPQSPPFEIGHNRRNNSDMNPVNLVWDAATPAGARLYVNGSYVATAPANPTGIFGTGVSGAAHMAVTLMEDIHFVMPAGSEGQTAAVDMVGINNQYAGRVFVMQNNTSPDSWQDIVFYVHEVNARASYTWDTPPGGYGFLRIIKTDMTGNSLAGAVFTITGDDSSMPMTVTVPAGGWTSGALVPGTYTITEITPPPGFTLASNPTQTIVVTENHTSTAPAIVTFANSPSTTPGPSPSPRPNGVTIQKICAITRENIPGALMRLRGMSAHQVVTGDGQTWTINNTGINVSQVLTEGAITALPGGVTSTVRDGVWILEGLPYGFYMVEEERAPEGFSMYPQHTAFGFWKLPPGVRIDSPDGLVYNIVEYQPGTNHILITFENYPFSCVIIYKREMSNGVGNNQLLAGAHFRIQGYYPGNPAIPIDRTGVTDANGRLVFCNLPAGHFTITEIAPPSGFLLGDNNVWTVNLGWGQRCGNCQGSHAFTSAPTHTFFNAPKSSLEILKIDGITNEPLAGAIFEIYDPTTGESWQATSGANGIAVLGRGNYGNFLYPGRTYIIREIVAPEGYVLMDGPREIVLSPGDENRITWRNWRNPGLTIIKECQDTGERLAGAHFTIVAQGSGRPLPTDFPMITNENGEIVIPWTLFEGESERNFIITETVPPPGFHLADPNWQLVTLQAGHDHTVVFSNRRMPTLTIQKTDELTGAPIQGAEFTVERLSPAPAGMITGNPFRTNAQGQIVLPDLPAGVYRIIETRAANNYWLNTDIANRTWTITIRENEDYLLQVENIMLPTLIITKMNQVTFRPVPLTRFLVEFETPSTGNVIRIGEFVTDANGQIILPFVQPGWYRITETHPAPGMSLNVNNSYRVFLAPGQNTYQLLTQMPGLIQSNNESPEQVTPNTPVNTEPDLPPNWGDMPDDVRIAAATASLQVTGGDPHLVGEGIWNWPLNSIVIKKTCSVTGQLLQGATFEVVHTSAGVSGTLGTVIGRFTTDHSGVIVLTGLIPGSYVVRELIPPSNFTLSVTNTQTVHLMPDGHSVVEVVFDNDPYGSLVISKRCAVTGVPLANAEFRVVNSSGAVVGTANGLFRTNAQGEILIPNLPPDSYVITEVRAPNGFILDSVPQTIRINATGNTYRVEFTNTPESSVVIRKVSGFDGSPLAGARFRVERQDGTLVGEFTTDSTGTITVPGLIGWVTVTETHPPQGYTLATNSSRTVEVRPGTPTILEFVNERIPGLTIEKVDEDGRALAGAEFELRRPDGSLVGRQTTNSAGIAIFPGLTPGVYIITEVRAPDGYMILEGPRTIELRAGQNQVERFVNAKLPSVVIRKICGDTGRPLPGVVFEFARYFGNGNTGQRLKNYAVDNSYEFVTDASGHIYLPTLEHGTWIAIETRPLPGFMAAQPVTFVVGINGDHTITIRNYRYPDFAILKLDGDTRRPLAGVLFEIAHDIGNGTAGQRLVNPADGTTTFATDAAGRIPLPGIQPGRYIAVETRALSGYSLAAPVLFTVEAGQNRTITVYNYRTPGLVIRKINSVTRQPIEGVVFQIARPNGERVQNPQTGFFDFVTNRDGLIHLPELPDGTYLVTETRPAEGYFGLDEPILVEVNSASRRQDYLLVVENTPASGLLIIKRDAHTRQPLQGVEFDIRHADGRRVTGLIADQNQPGTHANSPNLGPNGGFLTDHRGRIIINHLPVGVFHITEVAPLPGYILDTTVYVVTVTPGRLSTLEVYNVQMAGLRINKICSVSRQPIYGVEFRIFDFNTNQEVAGPFFTDNNGVIYFRGILPHGRYIIRETREAPGFIRDTMPRTIEFRAGMITEITWENTPIAGQIQITKLSSADNEVNGLPRGSRLEGAVFEVRDWRTGNVVDQFRTAANGVGASRPLPLGRYTVHEIQAPPFYRRSDVVLDITIEHSGQIVRYNFYNEPANIGVDIRKIGPEEVMPGQRITWNVTTIANSSTVELNSFFWRDVLPTNAVRLDRVFTGTFNQSVRYSVLFRTNRHPDLRVAYDNLLSTTNHGLTMSPTALGLESGEFVTEIMFQFGTVRAGFRSVEAPRIEAIVLDGLQNGMEFVNRVYVGGMHGGEWVIGNHRWVTRVFRPQTGTLPRTGR